jgi:putative RNA 2'-phosphotransferase
VNKASGRRRKQLSWLLRHGAGEAGLALNEAGWARIDDLLALLDMTRAELPEALETNDKCRLQLDRTHIRACQRHSIVNMPVTQEALERTWTVVSPTSSLWHGTTVAAIPGIAECGIRPGGRTLVHLAPSSSSRVGRRASVEVLLEISPDRLTDAEPTIFEAPPTA